MDINNLINNEHIVELIQRFPELGQSREKVIQLYITIKNCFFNKNFLFCCGNGGSCSDAEHLVGELAKNFLIQRKIPENLRIELDKQFPEEKFTEKLQPGFRAMTLQGMPSLSTACMNDIDPNMVYAQQLFVYGHEGDVLLGFSTSGKAVNICNAFKVAKCMGIKTVLLTGNNPNGICRQYADLVVDVPAKESYLVQEYHLPVYHALAIMLEEEFYGRHD